MDKCSLDPGSTKVNKLTYCNVGFSIQQGKNIFVLNRKKKRNILLGNLGNVEVIQHTFQILKHVETLL